MVMMTPAAARAFVMTAPSVTAAVAPMSAYLFEVCFLQFVKAAVERDQFRRRRLHVGKTVL